MNRLALAMGLFGWLLTGCGDDDGATPGDASTDAIALDAQPDLGRDAGRDMGGTRDMGTRDTGTRDMAMPPDEDSGPPPPPSDAGPDPDEMRGCDPLDDPCPSGSKCTVVIDVDAMDVQTVYTRCTEDGTRMVGGRCNFDMSEPTPDGTRTFTDNCARGAFCNTLPGRRFPICLAYCADGADCGDAELCLGVDPTLDLGMCMLQPACDPLRQTGCPAGQGCYVVSDGYRVLPSCAPYVADETGGDGTYDQPCTFVNNCQPGLNCYAGADMMGRCRTLCDPEAGGVGGPLPDGGVDAGPPVDAGAPTDAGGAMDASADDAGPPADAGGATDAGPTPTATCPAGQGTCTVEIPEGVMFPLVPPTGVCI